MDRKKFEDLNNMLIPNVHLNDVLSELNKTLKNNPIIIAQYIHDIEKNNSSIRYNVLSKIIEKNNSIIEPLKAKLIFNDFFNQKTETPYEILRNEFLKIKNNKFVNYNHLLIVAKEMINNHIETFIKLEEEFISDPKLSKLFFNRQYDVNKGKYFYQKLIACESLYDQQLNDILNARKIEPFSLFEAFTKNEEVTLKNLSLSVYPKFQAEMKVLIHQVIQDYWSHLTQSKKDNSAIFDYIMDNDMQNIIYNFKNLNQEQVEKLIEKSIQKKEVLILNGMDQIHPVYEFNPDSDTYNQDYYYTKVFTHLLENESDFLKKIYNDRFLPLIISLDKKEKLKEYYQSKEIFHDFYEIGDTVFTRNIKMNPLQLSIYQEKKSYMIADKSITAYANYQKIINEPIHLTILAYEKKIHLLESLEFKEYYFKNNVLKYFDYDYLPLEVKPLYLSLLSIEDLKQQTELLFQNDKLSQKDYQFILNVCDCHLNGEHNGSDVINLKEIKSKAENNMILKNMPLNDSIKKPKSKI